MRKIYNLLIITFLVFWTNTLNIKADLPNSIGPIRENKEDVLYDGCGIGVNNDGCYAALIKFFESGNKTTAVICTDYEKTSPAEGYNSEAQTGVSCNLTNDWKEDVRYGIASIIKTASPYFNINQTNLEYFAAEMAINKFLNEKIGEGAGNSINTNIITDQYKSKINEYLDIANTAYNNHSNDSKLEISLSTTELTFSSVESGHVSNSITVEGFSNYVVTTNKGIVEKDGNSFKIFIPTGTINDKTDIKVSVKATKTIELASNYNCGDSYQSVTPILLETKTINSNEVTASGKFTPNPGMIIHKLDSNNIPISGATIEVTGPNDYKNTFTTEGDPINLVNLTYGTYKIKETEAPSGYLIAEEKVVTLSENNLFAEVTIINKKTKITVLKVNSSNNSGLAGATLEIQDKDGNIVKYCKDSDGNNNAECKWVSTEDPYVIEGMPLGNYYLIETKAPNGFNLNKEKVEFRITNDDVTHNIDMKNAIIRVEILKVNSSNKKGLAGATLEIQDKDGNIVKYCKDSDGNNNAECKWISTTDAYVIEGMPLGNYYLVETKAPDGYVLNKERTEFQIIGDGKIVQVEMKNDLEVKVPDTLSSKSALMVAVAMFDIFLGISILGYVKTRTKDNY